MLWILLLLTAAIALCSWLSPPGSSLNRSAWQAFDCAVASLSQGNDDDVPSALGAPPSRARLLARPVQGRAALPPRYHRRQRKYERESRRSCRSA